MAGKRAKKVQAVQDEKVTKPIRLDMTVTDYQRLERCAKERGLTKASYAWQAVLERIRADEGGGK
jgi:hypothetical protein